MGIDDVLSAIRRRTSVRGYVDAPVPEDQLDALMAWSGSADHLANAGSSGQAGDRARIVLVPERERVARILTTIVGSYGLIRNAPHLLAGILPRDTTLAHLDLGYALEQVVLKATEMGLGTCWITGSFDPEQAADLVEVDPTEVAVAVCALGQPAQEGWSRLHSEAVHRLAGGHRRKPLSKVVFSERWGETWSPDGADPGLVSVLAHARLAPSAVNRQPWRFIVREEGLALALAQPAPIDGGIVMAHVALASAALERQGRWWLCLDEAAKAQAWELPRGAIPVAVFRP